MSYEPWVVPSNVPSALPVERMRSRGVPGFGESDPIRSPIRALDMTQKVMLAIHGVVLVAVSYHGYRRNGNSVPWGIGWGLGGLICPTVTMGFALTQGFAKKVSA